MKTRILIIAIISIILLINVVSAATSIHTEMNVEDGKATITQTVNDQTIEIETNESASILTEIKDSIISFFVDASGSGKLEAELAGEDYSMNTTVDDNTESYEDSGRFSKVYKFFKKILFFGRVKNEK